MAKITDLKNPLTSKDVNVLNPLDWVQSIGYVAWLGLVAVLGAKALIKADAIIPGNNTPSCYVKAAAAPEVKGEAFTVI